MTTRPPGDHDAWHPGLSSDIPRELRSRATLYDPANSTVPHDEAQTAAEFCGLKPPEMVAFTARRLAVHECLIRVSADLHVPDGPNYEDLGINMRGMAARILDGYVLPHLPEIEAAFAAFRAEAETRLSAILDRDVFAPAPPPPAPAPKGLLSRLFGSKPPPPAPPPPAPELSALPAWQQVIAREAHDLDHACHEALHTICAGIMRRSGRLMGDKALIARFALNRVNNSFGARRIRELIAPWFDAAVAAEGYRFLPAQPAPFVLNVKGASAAGKSTLRAHQRRLTERLGLPWDDFALISPDYWRKFLLDYDSLGPDYKYAAMLTGQELEIIDKKLDHYMEAKAARSEMPHLLIDRFRFDSFDDPATQAGEGRLLSRFGDTVFMFFVVTPPAETVERAWKRGLETGRYKAVDDILFHNIEAYTGISQLFLNWVKKHDQKVHFEFLDNGVPQGETPRTMAFAWNDSLTVLDVEGMRRIDLYRNVNHAASSPDEVLPPGVTISSDFLGDCIGKIGTVSFVDPQELRVQGQTRAGRCAYQRDGFFAAHDLRSVGPCPDGDPPDFDAPHEQKYTVGTWGKPG